MGEFVLDIIGTSTDSTREESTMDRVASAGFEGIAQMLLEQKKLMDALESENRELRRQISELRRGVGIAVIIEGKTIQLANDGNSSNVSAQSQAALQSLQGMQNTPPPTSGGNNPYGNNNNGRSTNGQPQVNLNGEKRDSNNNNTRSPLADSFVL
ncbi:hypothetical protein ccbrp13_48920 [Ktedonobacteria bacterium brp13]|nr:hypothetical protein ccbrp13_48920 [Ktedonobacteria bacterium brp13]